MLNLSLCSMSSNITAQDLRAKYESYIHTLNAAERSESDALYETLTNHIEASVNHNGKILDYAAYAQLIPPSTHFEVVELLVDPDKLQVAARLDITVAEKRVTEHVFYHFSENGKIDRVWSLVQDGRPTV